MAATTTARVFGVISALVLACVAARGASAQFSPPSTFLGTVADEQGLVTEGMNVEAYIGETLCSLPSGGPADATTFPYGEGEGRVVFYVVDVVEDAQTEGCGRPGSEVRIKIGERFANETGLWLRGPVRLDLTFGNIEPAVQPTVTPTPVPPTNTPSPTPDPAATPEPAETSEPADTPGTVDATSSPSTAGPTSGTPPADSTEGPGAAETRPGTLGNAADTASFDGGEGFPPWAMLLIGAGVVALAGGAVGVVAAQRTRDGEL